MVWRVRRYLSNVWQEQLQVESSIGGAQVDVHKTIILNITADTDEYNIFTSAGSPALPVSVLVNVASGVVVGSTSTSNPAMDTGTGWHSQSQLFMTNDGLIAGAGGTGGIGGNVVKGDPPSCGVASAGTAGGDAINLQFDIETINNGVINGGGGGGGGGGGAGVHAFSSNGCAGGGGGGGGSGSGSGGAGGTTDCGTTATGGTGSAGTDIEGGGGGSAGSGNVGGHTYSGGSGGTGGLPAVAGDTGSTGVEVGNGCSSSGAAGGAAGKAVEPNAFTLTLTNNGTVAGATT